MKRFSVNYDERDCVPMATPENSGVQPLTHSAITSNGDLGGYGTISPLSGNSKTQQSAVAVLDHHIAAAKGQTSTCDKPMDSSLSFIDVAYSIPEGWRCSNKRKVKTILDSVSGVMLPGVNAIMGPTGSGKTSLLDILADRKSSSRIGGLVLVNGERRMKNFRFVSGYVVQDDVVTGNLSVRENLHFSAALRLPSKMSHRQRSERVEKVIDELGLRACADTRIGNEFIRGVSGGERKRTNIGMELIIEPQVLFLDEPTTGLDAHTAVSVVKLLKDLTTNSERIVIMSIHQPRYSIFKLFDTITLLSLGSLVYHGPAGQILNYFSTIGFECEEHDNPADFLLDVIMQCELEDSRREDDEATPLLRNKDPEVAVTKLNSDLGSKFRQSAEFRQTNTILQPMIQHATEAEGGVTKTNGDHLCSIDSYATNSLWQFLVVALRSVVNMWRNPMTNVLQIFVMVIFALVVGGIFFQRPQTPRGMQDRLGVIFFLIMSQVFGNLGAIEVFMKERAAFLHETSSGYYRVSVFFVAKVLTDLLFLRTVPLSVFCCITYFMIGFQVSVEKFFVYYLTLALTTLAGAALAFTFSAMVSVFAVANLLVSLVFILYMVFGGFLIGLDSIPEWIQWLKYLSIFRYGIEAIAVNELRDQVYNHTLRANESCTFRPEGPYCVAYGNDVLEFQGYHKDWVWYDEIALGASGIAWLALTYVVLRVVKVYYRHHR